MRTLYTLHTCRCAFSKLAVQITEVPPFCQAAAGKGGNLRTLKKVAGLMTEDASQFCEKVAKCDEKECNTRLTRRAK